MIKHLILLFIFSFGIILGDENSELNLEKDQILYVKFDNIRLRKEPYENSRTTDFIPLGESVIFLGELSKDTFTTKIRGKILKDRWIKVKSIFNEEGWIFGGSIQKEKIERKVNIIQLGTYHSGEAEMNSGTNFYAVIKKKGKYYIKKDKIYVKAVRDEISDKINEKTGRKIYSKLKNVEYSFLFRGIDAVENSIIPGIKEGRYGEIRDSLFIEDTNRKKYIFSSKFDKKFSLDLQIENQNINFFINDWSNDSIPSLEWAGDINGDGLLDFFINDSDHYNFTSITLYISSKKNGKIKYKSIGSIKSVGC